jgi:hypothetical protein
MPARPNPSKAKSAPPAGKVFTIVSAGIGAFISGSLIFGSGFMTSLGEQRSRQCEVAATVVTDDNLNVLIGGPNGTALIAQATNRLNLCLKRSL